MNKKTKYTRNGALLGMVVGGLKNVIEQRRTATPGEPFHWDRFIQATTKGGILGAAGGLVIGAVFDYQNSLEAPINTDKALALFVQANILLKSDPAYLVLGKKAQILAALLKTRFHREVKGTPYKYGSSENGTGLRDKADIDLCVECHPGSFGSVADMYSSMQRFLETLVGSYGIVSIREQRVSIGVYFRIRGKDRKIDVTPKKLSYHSSKNTSGYLHLNKNGIFETSSRTKTNVQLLKSIQLSEPQRKILVVLKTIKETRDLPLPSILLQLLVLRTYDAYRGSIPPTLTEKVLLVLRYIAESIETAAIRSPENTNNVLTEALTHSEKSKIRKICQEIMEEYEYQPNSIIRDLK